MSMSVGYLFFDRVEADPIWDLRWQEFLRRYPSARKRVKDLATAYNLTPDEISSGRTDEDVFGDVLATRTIRWTIQRSSPPFWLFGEMMYLVPSLRKHAARVSTGWVGDSYALAACAIDMYLRKRIDKPTTAAVLKLHCMGRPGRWFELPKKHKSMLDRLMTRQDLLRPLYRWQPPDACQYSGSGSIDCDNCLNRSGTGRFIKFFERAWAENPPVPYLAKYESRWLSPTPSSSAESVPARFREFDLARQIRGALRKVARFEQPSIIRDTT